VTVKHILVLFTGHPSQLALIVTDI